MIKALIAFYIRLRDYAPFIKTTTASALAVFAKASADLDRIKAHNIEMARMAKEAEATAKAARATAEDEIAGAVRTKAAIDQILGK